jgi:hypothetical protein
MWFCGPVLAMCVMVSGQLIKRTTLLKDSEEGRKLRNSKEGAEDAYDRVLENSMPYNRGCRELRWQRLGVW